MPSVRPRARAPAFALRGGVMPDSAHNGGSGGRKSFTDVVSLFQPIIPAPGTAVRPDAVQPVAPKLQAPEPPPPAPPIAAPATPPPPPISTPTTPSRLMPAPAQSEEAWAAAWEPQPNWRPPRRPWTLLVLIPCGIFAAWVVMTADPVAIRSFVNQHVWSREAHELPTPAVPEPTPAPAPAASSPSVQRIEPGLPLTPVVPEQPRSEPAVPAAGVPLGPVVLPPKAPETPAEAPSAPPAAAANPDAASQASAPTSPSTAAAIPEPPPAENAAPPAVASQPPPAPAFGVIGIRYRRGTPSGEAEAARLSARLQPQAERVETRAVATGLSAPTVLYFRPDDRAGALSLAQRLPVGGAGWTVRQGQGRQRSGYLEVWLP